MGATLVVAMANAGGIEERAAELVNAATSLGETVVLGVVARQLDAPLTFELAGVARAIAVRVPDNVAVAEVWPQAVGKLLELTEASTILTPFSWDTAAASARLAVERNLSLISDAVALARGEGGGLMAERAIFSGKLIARLRVSAEAPALVLVRPGAWHPAPGATARPVEVVEVDAWEPPRVRIVEAIEPSGGDEDLTRAEVVFAVGRGIGSQGNLHLFASAARRCGASLGASRPLVDMGWLPRSQQVGQSGVTVKPRVYVAFGISGAVQHLAGMSAANTIVAVNTDQDAPIFDTAHLGSFVDALEVAKYLAND